MKNLKILLIWMVTTCLLLGLSRLGISADQKENMEPVKEEGTKEEILEDISRKFSVDKETVKGLAEEMGKEGMSLREVTRLVMLAWSRTENMIKEGKVPKERREEVIKENIKFFHDKLKSGSTWKELSKELKSKPKPEEEIKDAVYEKVSKEFSISRDDIKKVEEKFMESDKDRPLRKTVMLIILARARTDKLMKEGKFTKDQEKEALEDSVNHFMEEKQKKIGWGEMASEVDVSGFEVNNWANKIMELK